MTATRRSRAGSVSARPCSTGAGTCCSPSRRPRPSAPARPGPGLAADDARDRGRRGRLDATSSTRGGRHRDKDHRLRLDVFFVGLLVFASVLMLRQPLFFIFMIAGFFYATILRPLPLAVVGVAATSILVNTLIAGFPQNAGGVDLLPRDHHRPDRRDQRRRRASARRSTEQNEERREALARLEAALAENAGLHAQLLTQAREAGVLDERQRMAREIHDTIAQGLTGIVTQLEAADQARDRPADRDRHLDERQAARPREPDRGAPVGRGVDARRARGRDAAGGPRGRSRASGPSSTGSRSTSRSPAR